MAATASTEARKRESFTRGMAAETLWGRLPTCAAVDYRRPSVANAAESRLTIGRRLPTCPTELHACHSSGVSEEPLEELAGVAADFGQGDIQRLLVEVSRSPAVDQFGEHVELGLRG